MYLLPNRMCSLIGRGALKECLFNLNFGWIVYTTGIRVQFTLVLEKKKKKTKKNLSYL